VTRAELVAMARFARSFDAYARSMYATYAAIDASTPYADSVLRTADEDAHVANVLRNAIRAALDTNRTEEA
jgi:hypothetical protein